MLYKENSFVGVIILRDFEVISFKQFKKDISEDEELYKKVRIPKRDTKGAAGYDFFAIEEFELNPGESKKVPTGIKVCMEEDEVLFLVLRSSMGFYYNLRLCNQVGIIDSDYYNNLDNEGHIWFKIQNEGKEKLKIKQGEAFGQGVFIKYLTTNSEKNEFIERRNRY